MVAKVTAKAARRPGRPVSGDPFDGREQLLETAHLLLLEANGLPVSLNYICERAGVNQAMVAYHFGGKRNLLIAVFSRASQGWGPGLQSLLALDASPTEKLRIHIRETIRNFRRHPYISRLMTELTLTQSPKGAEDLAAIYVLPLIGFYEALIAQGLSAGEFKPKAAVDMFVSIIGQAEFMFSSRALLSTAFGIAEIDDEVESRLVDHMCDLVLNGIRAT